MADSQVIEVPMAAFDYLKELMKEINTQDNRATATPYYYDLRYDEEVDDEMEASFRPRRGMCVEYGQTVFFTQKAADEYIKANSHNLPKGVYTFLCWGGRNPELQKLLASIGEVVGVKYERK